MRGKGQNTGQEASRKPELESTQASGSEEGRHFPTREQGLRPCPYCLQVWGMGFWCHHSLTAWFQHPTESLVSISSLDGPSAYSGGLCMSLWVPHTRPVLVPRIQPLPGALSSHRGQASAPAQLCVGTEHTGPCVPLRRAGDWTSRPGDLHCSPDRSETPAWKEACLRNETCGRSPSHG